MLACGASYDGETLWKFETKKAYRQWAVLDEQRLYLCADDVYCLETETGRLLWELKTFGTHSSEPVIEEGRLFFQCGGLYALNAATGNVLWEFWSGNWAEVSPVVSNGRVYAPAGNRLYCLNALSGQRLWSVKTGTIKKTPVLIGERLFFSVGEKIVCLDVSLRKVLWGFDVGSGSVQLASGGAYLLSAGSAGLVRAHQVESGQVQWQFDTDAPFVGFCGESEGQVLVSADTLYYLNTESGKTVWTCKPDNVFVRDAHFFSQHIFARSFQNRVYCISRQDGTLIRRIHLPQGGTLLWVGSDVVFISGGEHREVSGLSVPGL
jgi:outer membrane protein assembly factor BamB